MTNKTVYLVQGGKDINDRLGYEAGPYLLLNESRADYIKNTPKRKLTGKSAPKGNKSKDITWKQVLDLGYGTPLDFSVANNGKNEKFETIIILDESLQKEGYKFVKPFYTSQKGTLRATGISITEVRERRHHTRGEAVERVMKMPKGKPIGHFIRNLKGEKTKISFLYNGKYAQVKKDHVFLRYKLFLNKGTAQKQIFIDPIIRNDGSLKP